MYIHVSVLQCVAVCCSVLQCVAVCKYVGGRGAQGVHKMKGVREKVAG